MSEGHLTLLQRLDVAHERVQPDLLLGCPDKTTVSWKDPVSIKQLDHLDVQPGTQEHHESAEVDLRDWWAVEVIDTLDLEAGLLLDLLTAWVLDPLSGLDPDPLVVSSVDLRTDHDLDRLPDRADRVLQANARARASTTTIVLSLIHI